MKINRKGFTVLEVLAVIIILGILITLAYIGVSQYIRQTNDALYEDYEKNIKAGATNYLIDHTGSIPNVGDEHRIRIDVSKLICEGYVKPLEDPKVDGATCNLESYAIVTRKEDSDSGNMDIEYKACLKCGDYTSSDCNITSFENILRKDASCEVE